MTPQLAFDLGTPAPVWSSIDIEDPRARAVYDRHYSRQTVGADGIVAPGWRILLWHEPVADRGAAIWACVLNRFRGQWFWRNSIFRNESPTRSSELVIAATATTYEVWLHRYRVLPDVPLITEIDIEATHKRRSKKHEPGHCYRVAGWTEVRRRGREHGRPPTVYLQAPPP